MMKTNSLQNPPNDLVDNNDFQVAMLEEGLIHRVALRALEFRRALGLSQAHVAKRLGTKQPSVARIEAGEANMTLRTLAQLALALEHPPEDFVTDRPMYTGGVWEQPQLTVVRGGLASSTRRAESLKGFEVDRSHRKVAAV